MRQSLCNRRQFCAGALALAWGVSPGVLNAADPLIELKVAGEVYVGKSVAFDDEKVWLQQPNGRLTELLLNDVTGHRKLTQPFRPQQLTEAQAALRREFGRPMEVVAAGPYVVCAPSATVRQHAATLEETYRGLHLYFTARGFQLRKPEFPLIAVVTENEQEFQRLAAHDKIPATRGLRGYYHQLSNRFLAFETADDRATAENRELSRPSLAWGNVSGDLHNTLIHEATHQVAFNVGLHRRLGDNPVWVVEGLATLFEAPGIRNPAGTAAKTRINPERFVWFGEYRQKRRPAKSLEKLIASDDLFSSAALDAYSEAWALTFYLTETQPAKYAQYLKLIMARPALQPYLPAERVQDFQQAFGKDLHLLEASLLRYQNSLQSP